MPDPIEFNPVDTLAAGAIGRPGQRRFMIQARSNGALLSVLLEKQQVSLLAAEANEFLDRIAQDETVEAEQGLDPVNDALCGQVVEAEPLFRANLIGIGYDPHRHLVLLELREYADPDEDDDTDDEDGDDEPEGFVARLYASRGQVRAMLRHGAASVERGRPPCPLCQFPMDPDGHACPRWN